MCASWHRNARRRTGFWLIDLVPRVQLSQAHQSELDISRLAVC